MHTTRPETRTPPETPEAPGTPADPAVAVLLRAGFSPVHVDRVRLVAPEVLELALARREPFAPGSHIEVAVAPTADRADDVPLIRHYSLSSDPTGATPWTIGVRRDGEASSLLHDVYGARSSGRLSADTERAGADRPAIYIRDPRNNFHFRAARPAFFAAGGIGITPLRSMITFADGLRLDWHLLYVGRTLDDMAYGRELLTAHGPDRVTLWPTAERGRPDLAAEAAPWLAAHPQGVAYACGPAGFAEALATGLANHPTTASAVLSEAQPTILEFESFDAAAGSPGDPAAADARGGLPFTVELADGRRVPVGAEQSILSALTAAGVRTLSSCQRGTCGTCETAILAGRADHRDHVLTDDERDANESMIICVSRSCQPVLRLDL